MATIRWVAAAAVSVVASCPTSHASNTVVVHGWLETGSSAGSYVMRAGPGEGVSLEIDDPLGRFVGSLPDYHRLTVQCKVLENSGIGIPKVEILNTHPPGTMAPTGLSCGVDAARFASCLGIPGANTGDSDGDGVPDIDDDFPFDPSEDTDTDGDGTGDNADDDDDGDEMLDTYEIANGLDPLVDDGAGDLDTDGQTNVAESVAGTAANDGSSFFGASEWMRVSPSTVQVTWDALPGRTYSIYFASDLGSPPAQVASGITVAAPGPTSENVAAPTVRGFYILEAEPITP